ncbi:phosphatase 2C-like domain-containing protein [Cokeromyces recurvatus]|uniref:phosphatase 2C-like domain-containing protein n=1 Tax=Cokeromyces recurvatus TaxID=90255 RepID=UPI002220EA7B|nr:phosphatase 2C-like domain-containing protein [Cokeromyces recurvatus]KAI7898607.1 phosphatase 2C-like domain-containing protein [Cokeromyces recurvatus]
MLLYRSYGFINKQSRQFICSFLHTVTSKRSVTAIIQQQQEKPRNNLNVIDFFHPSLSPTLFHYTLNLGVSGYAKRDKPIIESIDHNIYSSFQIGDDAYFKRSDALGVADGVGGWRAHKGANPALYSRKLMHYAQLELDRIRTNVRPQQLQVNPDPIQVLESAYHMTTLDAQNEGFVGSTTACIVILYQDELRIANLGDCGVSVIRQNDYIFRSEEQQHSFNYPYQLGTASFDSPMDAQQFNLKIEEGDIIILGSDGLFDNLYDDEILEEVHNCIKVQQDNKRQDIIIEPQLISDALAHRAKIVSEDPDNPSSPFQVRAMHEGLYYQVNNRKEYSILYFNIHFIGWKSR